MRKTKTVSKKTKKSGVKTKTIKTPKAGSPGNQTAKKLNAVVKKLDEAGVQFLLEQAEVLLHNMKVRRLNEERIKISSQKKTSAPAPVFDKRTIEVVEADDLRHFILVINNARNFFTREEMRKLAALCQAAGSADEGARNLYGWFSRFRKDVLIDTGISDSADLALRSMFRAISERYLPGKG